jgi:hypothetical protein
MAVNQARCLIPRCRWCQGMQTARSVSNSSCTATLNDSSCCITTCIQRQAIAHTQPSLQWCVSCVISFTRASAAVHQLLDFNCMRLQVRRQLPHNPAAAQAVSCAAVAAVAAAAVFTSAPGVALACSHDR